jgi:hypothetical protein
MSSLGFLGLSLARQPCGILYSFILLNLVRSFSLVVSHWDSVGEIKSTISVPTFQKETWTSLVNSKKNCLKYLVDDVVWLEIGHDEHHNIMTKKAKSHYHSNRAISSSLEFLSDIWQLKLPKIMSFLKFSFIISPLWQIFTKGN